MTAISAVRAITGGFSSAVTFFAGLSYCGTWASHLSLKVAENSAGKSAAVRTGVWLTELGSRVALLRWVARLNLAGLALSGLEIAVRVWVLPNSLESWCKRSVFRMDKIPSWTSGKPFTKLTEEQTELFKAFEEIQ